MNEYSHALEIPISAPASRVVSLVPSLTESLFDLHLGDRVVGVTDYCIHPADKLQNMLRVGGTRTPDIARIIDLRPDLVFANREENRKEDVEALQAAGIPVWVTYPRTVQDVFNLLWNIMYAFEETSMVPRVRLIEYSHNWVEGISRQQETAGKVCRVFVPIWNDPLMTFNADTYIHDLLRVCGGTNVFADYPDRYPCVTLDQVAAASPDVILLPDEPYAFGEGDIAQFAGLNVSHVHRVDGTLLSWFGTRIAYSLEQLPRLLCYDE
jgi:ABC-type Fe3+-hydroxamate transport system substrate-binding protein